MGRRVGRPAAAAVSSAEERSFLERRVRRRRTARRCRTAASSCAAPMARRARRPRRSRTHRRQAGAAFPEVSYRGIVGCAAFGASAEHGGRAGGRGRPVDARGVAPDAARWPIRSMARAAGLSPAPALRIRKAFGLQPHRSATLQAFPAARRSWTRRGASWPYPSPPDRAPALRHAGLGFVDRSGGSNGARGLPRSSSRRISAPSSPGATGTRNPSNGPKPPTISSHP